MQEINPPGGAPNPEAKNSSAHPLPAKAVRRRRWWIPGLVLLLALANVIRLRVTPELDGMYQNMQTAATIAGSAALLLGWWLFLGGWRWRTRLIGLGIVLLLLITVGLMIRIDGSFDGGGRPRIVWRWTPRRTGDVGALQPLGASKARPVAEGAADSPEYLGADRSGVLADLFLERDWAAHPPQELWRRPIGLGWSGFAVVGPNAITQEQRGEEELVVCYDLATGQSVWSHANHVRFSEPMGGDGPRATPTIHGDRVYALGATGLLDCLETGTGKLIWTRDILKENALPNTYFGKCSSPLVVDDVVLVTGGQAKQDTLLAFHRTDGSPAWKAGHDEASFSSPMLVTLTGKQQILCVNAASVTGHDPADGHILWEYSWANNKWPKCAQPIVLSGDRVLLSASFNAGCVLLQIKAGPSSGNSVEEIWKSRSMKSEFSNLVTRDGFLYGLDDGILACVDLATGQRRWKDGHYGHGQVLRAGDLLVVQTEPGALALVEADPAAFHEVARLNALSAKTWNIPTLAGELLLVRNDQEAVCYRLPRRHNIHSP